MRSALTLLACALAFAIAGCGGSGAASVVAPDGAPYSYQVPRGFVVTEGSFPGGDPKFLSTLAPEGNSHDGGIAAFQWTLGAAERSYPTAKLLAWLDRQTQLLYRGQGATLDRGIRARVDGRPAVCWTIRGFENAHEGRVDADSCAIVGAREVVQQACTWKPDTHREIERACAEVRATLKVT
jgi:hypothetical protein